MERLSDVFSCLSAPKLDLKEQGSTPWWGSLNVLPQISIFGHYLTPRGIIEDNNMKWLSLQLSECTQKPNLMGHLDKADKQQISGINVFS